MHRSSPRIPPWKSHNPSRTHSILRKYHWHDDLIRCRSPGPQFHDRPAGYGTDNFVLSGTLLPYEIVFENDPSATAPAQRVDITDQLDPNLDWSTLQLSGRRLRQHLHHDSRGLAALRHHREHDRERPDVRGPDRPELEPGHGRPLRVVPVDRPDDRSAAREPTDRLPPPEDGSGRGIGFVNFTVKPKAGLATGTQIRMSPTSRSTTRQKIATDQVNDEDPSQGIDPTKQALVTIDATPASSTVTALPAHTTATSFTVSWSGSDGTGPGIASIQRLCVR